MSSQQGTSFNELDPYGDFHEINDYIAAHSDGANEIINDGRKDPQKANSPIGLATSLPQKYSREYRIQRKIKHFRDRATHYRQQKYLVAQRAQHLKNNMNVA